MRNTSLESWEKIQQNLSERQIAVLNVIEELKEVTIKEIALHLNRNLNQFSGRLTELNKMGIITHVWRDGKKLRRGDCYVWRIKNAPVVETSTINQASLL